MNSKEEIIDWLRDAYAMERALETTLKKMSESESHSSECRANAARHLIETRVHAETVESLLHSLGSNTSAIKTGFGIMTETMKGMGNAMANDEAIKDLLAGYAMEHFEIASYRALVAGAKNASLPQVASACERIILDEQNMAKKIEAALPKAVEQYLSREESLRA